MADGTYTPLVYRAQGGSSFIVASGGTIKIETGGKVVPNSGTQAATIADASTAHALNATFSDTEVEGALNTLGTKLNSVLAALEAVGILATS